MSAAAALAPYAAPLISGHAEALAQASDEGTPKSGGSFVVVISADPSSCNTSLTTSVPESTLGSFIYEGLTRIESDFTAGPNLASSWTISDDGLVYTFKLAKAKWHDGKDFTSADAKYSLEEVSAKYGSRFKAAASKIKSIEAPDPETLVITLTSSYGPMLVSLTAYGGAAMLPKHIFEGTDPLSNPASIDKPVGTGPFKMKDWAHGDHITLEKNKDYWREGKPYLDEVILKIIPDGGTRVLAMKAGEVDYSYFYFFPVSRVAEAKADPNLQLREKALPEDKIIIWNVRKEPFNNPKVRQALYRATNMTYIQQVVYQKLGKVMVNHMDSRLGWAHDASIDLTEKYPFDLKAAAAALDEAGLKPDANGQRMTFRMAFDSADTDYGRIAQVLANNWGQIGIKLVIDAVPRAVMIERVFKDWDFDGTIQAYSTSGDPALGVARLYVSDAIVKTPFRNVSGYSNPEVDKLFAEGLAKTDTKARGEAYKKVSAILAEDMPVFPMWETAAINVATTRVHGRWAWSDGYSFWEDVWVD
ncbi:ABC transporter substrate-binding protein [Ancylobacter mangrovi]|uniref:ABC transporter substrate-binding protein n=1 Tax=Ancylobacter mangrovi TaxID=2972472 RepID=UPI002163B5D7|nr:ABC transporter substrate-binding protein [Ancylobacter mangrovi]MCS0503181.1 ABC transporter substrate-binding protein [Ancylobacter mangrovi]